MKKQHRNGSRYCQYCGNPLINEVRRQKLFKDDIVNIGNVVGIYPATFLLQYSK